MRLIASLALAGITAAFAMTAAAQVTFQKPEDAIKYRKGALTVMAAHYGALGAMANGRAPYDAAAAARHGETIQLVSTLPWSAFTAGTDKGDTRAKAEIWSEEAKFKQAHERAVTEVGRIAAAAKTGSLDNLKAAWGPNSGSCKACHDNFRKD
jgi:cytochrome c556